MRQGRFAAGWLLVGLVLMFAAVSPAQDITEPPMPFEALFSASGVAVGGQIQFAGVFEVPEDHHITDKSYGLFSLEPELPEGVTITATSWPDAVMKDGEETYYGSAVILLTLAVDADVTPGEYTLPYSYSYQICRDLEPEICFLPNGGERSITLTVLEAGATAIPVSHPAFGVATAGNGEAVSNGSSGSAGLENRLTSALEKGSFTAFFLVFIAGILISFTPCVYPMIPIIIGFVGSSAEGNRLKGFILSLFFVLGLVVVYAILGVIAGATGALFGAFMQNPVVLWFIVAVFIALGASMLGAFDITIPASLQGRMMSGERKGLVGAVLIGGVTGIVAAPCAGPPLLVLLSWIGNTGNLALGFFLMATFALGIGVLFVVIGTFAGAMTALPQAGPWMDKIKKGLGAVIFAVALYYVGLLVDHGYFTILLGGFLLIVGLFLGATARWEDLSSAGKYAKGIGMLLLLAGGFYFLLGLAKVNGISLAGAVASANTGAQVAAADEKHVPWTVNAHNEVLALAAEQGKPVLIDFYADWCGVCVELDHKVWNQQSVMDAVADAYLPLKLDYTRASSELEALRKQYGVGGLPTVMILGPDGTERSRFTSFKNPEQVISWLGEFGG